MKKISIQFNSLQYSSVFSKILVLICILFSHLLWGQTPSEPCGTGIATQMMINENPNYLNDLEKFNTECADFSGQQGCENTKSYLIPVVFHIMHNNGPENISDAQIDEALAQMNLQYAGGEGGFNTQIQFAKATIDPNGNCTTGINRILTNSPNGYYASYWADVEMKNLSRWPTDRYVNIWIVRCMLPDDDCNDNVGVFGYAPIFGGPLTAGIVVKHNNLGTTGTASGDESNTLSHEMGHYLSLYHVWGSDDQNCETNCHDQIDCETMGDRVCDTEPCVGPYGGNSCSPVPTTCEWVCANFPMGQFNYPRDNYMSYNHSCQNRFTECQSARMKFYLENYGQGLWSTSNLTCTGAGGFFGNDIIIQENTAWTTANLPNGGNITITGTLTIQPNPATPNTPVTLNIDPGVTVHFCGNGKTVVKPNTTLDLSGTLTNSCKGTWKGVEVWGDTDESQYFHNGKRWQGRLVSRSGSVIENAKTGVQLWGPDYYSNAGGQISCTGTTFRNNYRAVEFAPYENTLPDNNPSELDDVRNYLGSFSGCTFITNDDYPGDQQFNAFLHMTGVRGISIAGSSFTNNRTISSSNFVDWGYGIFANAAGFNVSATPVGGYPSSSYIASGFNNLGYGIYTAIDLAHKPYSVQQSNFNGCFVGLYNKGVSAGVMLFNTFNLGKVPSDAIIPITPLGSTTEQDQVGMMFENAISGFTFEENDFLKVSGNVTNTIGSICKGLGIFNNVVRKNRYTGISHGNVANGNSSGLHYLCNENTNVSKYDFLTIDDGIIRGRQGVFVSFDAQTNTFVYKAAGNRFSYIPGNTDSDFNTGAYAVSYYYDQNKPNQTPLDFSPLITIDPVSVNNDCLSNYCKPPCKSENELTQIKGGYYTDRNAWTTLKADYATAPTSEKAEGIAFRKSRMDEASYMIVLHEMHDTIGFSIDTLCTWIGNMYSVESDLWLASDYVRTGETNKATQLLDAAAAKYQLSTKEQSTVNEFKSVLELLSGKQIYALSKVTRGTLETYAGSEGYAAGLAQNILTWYGEHYPPAYTLNSTGQRNDNSLSGTSVQGKSVIIVPNPSSGLVVMRFTLPTKVQNASLRILDVNGRLVQAFESLSSNREASLNFIDSGMYFYQLVTDGSLIESGKIVIQH